MGVYANALAQKKTFTASSPEAGFLQALINSRVDPSPSVADAVNTVHVLAVDTVDHTGGNFTLTFSIRNTNGTTTTFTTGNIAHNADAAAIESAIDSAATSASVAGWTNSDISVSGGNLQSSTAVTLTFDGASVAGRAHGTTVFNDSLTGGTSPATRVTVTAVGQTSRPAWGVLHALDVITSTIPTQTARASTSSVTKGSDLTRVPAWFVMSMAREAAAEDVNNDSFFSIISAMGYDDRSGLVQERDRLSVI